MCCAVSFGPESNRRGSASPERSSLTCEPPTSTARTFIYAEEFESQVTGKERPSVLSGPGVAPAVEVSSRENWPAESGTSLIEEFDQVGSLIVPGCVLAIAAARVKVMVPK